MKSVICFIFPCEMKIHFGNSYLPVRLGKAKIQVPESSLQYFAVLCSVVVNSVTGDKWASIIFVGDLVSAMTSY